MAALVDTSICAPIVAIMTWLTWPGDLPAVPWNWLDTFADWTLARPMVVFGPALWVVAVSIGYNLSFGLRGTETPGKRLLGLHTVDASGRFPSPRRLVALALSRALSTAVFLGGHLWALADPHRRTLHDRLARVWLLRAESPADAPNAQVVASKG